LQNKDNIILGLRKTNTTLNNFINNENKLYFENEICITEPTIIIKKIHDELKIYQECYKNICEHFNQIKKKSERYQNIIKVKE
jgi:hypothetical protein